MFKIPKEQFQHLNNIMISRFHERLLAFLKKELPEECSKYDEAGLLLLINECHKKATKKYNLKTEQDIAIFSYIELCWGPNFDYAPRARRILENSNQDSMDKFAELLGLPDLVEHT